MQKKHALIPTFMLVALLIGACAPRSSTMLEATRAESTAEAASFCRLSVNGRWIEDEAGRRVVLHGANLPTLTEMNDSDQKPDARLRDLADAGAKVVRVRVADSEITPTFIPGPVSSFIRQANDLGMLVILSWGDVIRAPVNDGADAAEDWLRLMVDYLKNNPGVWFDPTDGIRDVNSKRQRAIAQRLIDVTRGYNATNPIVINQPNWLSDPDPDTRQPLSGGNIVYGIDVEDMNQYPLDTAPFLFTRWQNSRVAVDELGIGVIAAEYRKDSTSPSNGAALRRFWQDQAAQHPIDLHDCR